MDDQLKRRLVGAAVVVSLGIIFLPIILDGGRHAELKKVHIKIPPTPEVNYASSIEQPVEATEPDPPIVAEPFANPTISRLEQADSGRHDDTEQKKPERPPKTDIATTQPVNSPKMSQEVPDRKPNGYVGKTSAAGIKPLMLESTSDSQAIRPVRKSNLPESSKVTSPVTIWVIQVGSFSNRANAVELKDKLRKNGFKSFVESFENTGESSHRVRIGPEADRGRAEESLSMLKSKLKINGIIVSYP